MLLPAKWRIPVRICICCKVVFERRLFEYTSSLSNASYYGVGDFSCKVKCSPFFQFEIFPGSGEDMSFILQG